MRLVRYGSCLLILPIAVSAEEPISLQPGQQQLFLDDYIIERVDGLKRTIHQPEDIVENPVILPEHPWEHRRIPFGSVTWFPAERRFKCWYLAMNIYDSRPGFRGYRKEHHVPIHEAAFICYAESPDGIHWTKPELGIHEFRGSKKNNIVLVSPGTHFDSTSVMHLPHDKQWPYRMMTFIGRWPYKEDLVKKQWGDPPPFRITRHGHYAFGSRDGIHWEELNDNEPVLRAHDRSMFWWDRAKRIFAGAARRSHEGKRAQANAWSRDMIRWTITPEWIHVADERDHPGDEAEAAYGFRYGSQWVGFAEMQRVRKGRDVKINWELLTSRDGRIWSRPFRELFFADGAEETWRYKVFKVFSNPPIEHDGRLMIYDGGKTWMGPTSQAAAFGRRPMPDRIEEGISDFWPTWHAKTGTLLGTGHTIRYRDDTLPPLPRPRDTTYSVYDPQTRRWSPFRKLKTPDDDLFFMDGAGSTQRVDLKNGDILLPTYTGLRKTAKGRFSFQGIAFVMRCPFDGHTLKYIEHGDTLTLPTGRGFTEPSLVRFAGQYLMTLRNNEHNYVTVGKDGLHFGDVHRLKFDDGADLGSYNTQTHWLTLGDRLYLVYTRRGANNDHVMRHRAPLFIAQFDPHRLCVIRDTEQIAVPERGARLGNFGITKISDHESWITVAEWMQTTAPNPHDPTVCEKYGSDNSVYVAKVRSSN